MGSFFFFFSASTSYSKLSNGLIYGDNFTSDNWSGIKFNTVENLALFPFGSLPTPLVAPTTGEDRCGRNPVAFLESGELNIFYDGPSQPPGGPFYTHRATSTDGGKTITREGKFAVGEAKGTGGVWNGVALGWVEKRGSTYYWNRVILSGATVAGYTDLWDQPYFGDVWSSDSLEGEWTYVRQMENVPSSWAAVSSLPGSVIKVGEVYYLIHQGHSGNGLWRVGYSSSLSPTGPWDLGTEFLNQTILGDSRLPENPKMFYHPTLNKYVLLTNLITPTGSHTDQNAIQIADDITDFGSGSLRRIQRLCPADAVNAIGVVCHIGKPDQGVVIGVNGGIPVVYDADGSFQSPGWHYIRNIRCAILEPSTHALRYEGGTPGINEYTFKSETNGNFIAEFGVEFAANTINTNVAFVYRCDGTSNNCYRLVVRNGGEKLLIDKFIDGGYFTVSSSSATLGTIGNFIHRIKLVVNGTSHKAYLDSELQIDTTDTSRTTGTHIGFAAMNANNAMIRKFHMRNSDNVIVSGLTPGLAATLYAEGKMFVVSANANSEGVATLTTSHYPHEGIEYGGNYITPTGGVYGGDEYRL